MSEIDQVENAKDFELTHFVVPGEEGRDHIEEMTETFIIELKRMRWTNGMILDAFRNPLYAGPHYAYKERGEQHILDLLEGVRIRRSHEL